MATLNIGADDLVDNPTPRVPVSLCLDTSGSMGGSPIEERVRGVNLFYDAIDEDDDAHDSAEINIVEFNSSAGLVHDFASIERLLAHLLAYRQRCDRHGRGRESRSSTRWTGARPRTRTAASCTTSRGSSS